MAKKSNIPLFIFGAGIVALLASFVFLALVLRTRPEPQLEANLPVLAEAPGFTLTSSLGNSFDAASLQGKIWVADFFFTSCAGPCPILSKRMAGLQEASKALPDVHFVSVTVDPETDTPERLHAYGGEYGADFDRWHFLTGDMADIKELAVEGFKIGSVDDPMIHSTRLILTDREGQVRGYYNGLVDEDMAELEAAIHALAQESSK